MYPVGFTFLGLRHNIHESIKMPNCRWRSASYIQACNIRSANTFENYIPTFRGKSVKPWKSLLRPLVWRSFTSLIVLRIINNSLKRIFFFSKPQGRIARTLNVVYTRMYNENIVPPPPLAWRSAFKWYVLSRLASFSTAHLPILLAVRRLTRSGVGNVACGSRRHRRAAPTRAVPKPSANGVFFRIPLLSFPPPFALSFHPRLPSIRLFLTSSFSSLFVIFFSFLSDD